MKILMFSRFFFPHLGGVEKHVEMVAKELIKLNHEITVITLNHDLKLPDLQTHQGLKIIRIPFSENKLTLWKNLWRHRHLIASQDLIHCHDVFFWYLPFRFIYPTKPVYTTFHGWEGIYPVPHRFIFARKIWETLSRGNICVGDYLKKHYGTKPDYVTYGAAEVSNSRADRQQNTISEIVWVGRLEEDLGLPDYLLALKNISKNHQVKITFVGDGSLRSEAEKIGMVTGFVQNVNKYLQKPCLVLSSSYLTMLTAMAYGRPVFALYQNQLKKDYLKLFPGSRYIRLAGNSTELTSQINNALAKQKHPQEHVLKGQQFAKEQTWSKVAKIYLNLWQK